MTKRYSKLLRGRDPEQPGCRERGEQRSPPPGELPSSAGAEMQEQAPRPGKSHPAALPGKGNNEGRKVKTKGLFEKLQKDFKPGLCPVAQL